MDWLLELRDRNALLFGFGLVNFILALGFIVLSRTHPVEIVGVNGWYKPIKFALSIGIYSWTMAWYMHYLTGSLSWIDWTIVIALGFEIIYIGLQAWRGEQSHFNVSTPLYARLYNLMAIAATAVSVVTAVVAVRFFGELSVELPNHFLWAIRLGLILFVIFSLEGFVMGASMSHTIGGPDGGDGLPFLNWSRQYGDPRIAHFVGMHAMQVLPLLSFYLLKSVRLTLVVAGVYALIAVYVLLQALWGRPLLT